MVDEEKDRKIIKQQSNVAIRLRETIMELETKMTSLQNDFFLVVKQNKVLEFMIETMKEERMKLLQELEEIKIIKQINKKTPKAK